MKSPASPSNRGARGAQSPRKRGRLARLLLVAPIRPAASAFSVNPVACFISERRDLITHDYVNYEQLCRSH
jgi:hypothetical protein